MSNRGNVVSWVSIPDPQNYCYQTALQTELRVSGFQYRLQKLMNRKKRMLYSMLSHVLSRTTLLLALSHLPLEAEKPGSDTSFQEDGHYEGS